MSKRKRSEIEDKIDAIQDRAVRIKASRLQAKISHGHKTLKDALNLARGFERQKMGRRQKQSSSEPHTLLRLREEVIVLKELDLVKTANDHLFKQMFRTKRIREAQAFIALFGEQVKVPGPASVAEANVIGRLFKARPVMDVLPGIMEGIKQVLGLEDQSDLKAFVRERNTTASQEGDDRSKSIRLQHEEDDFVGFSDAPPTTEPPGTYSDGGGIDEHGLGIYKHRLAAASDESENDDGDVTDDLNPMEVSDTPEGQDHDRESSRSEPSDENDKEDTQLHQNTAYQHSDAMSSTSFLPSLSMGGYYSGSESSDMDDGNRGPAIPKDRKNRRGQRARQQLAELKYGQNAKHLQKQKKAKEGTDVGWDPRRGAVDRHRRSGKDGFARNKKVAVTGANGEAIIGVDRIVKRKSEGKGDGGNKRSEGPLHPSWEAAKKRKQETGKVAFAGKKITFE